MKLEFICVSILQTLIIYSRHYRNNSYYKNLSLIFRPYLEKNGKKNGKGKRKGKTEKNGKKTEKKRKEKRKEKQKEKTERENGKGKQKEKRRIIKYLYFPLMSSF
ncbi:hypothetical protein ACSAZK_10190 [Methanosarcina sp. Mfa9]|uniref:hypothetical protein n=1 Tax=Methanosarcina sp. Mfa9 TaxID=3439063 RepID=UPI003F877FD0